MHDDIQTYLTAITAGERHSYIEVRQRTPSGMLQRFFPAHAISATARHILRTAQHGDVYVGVAPRTRRAGGKAAITHSHLVWADLDQPDAIQRLAELGLPASMIIRSSPGHLHTYWRLRAPVPAAQLEQLNARLALALAADTHCIDAARILRPPASFNFKHTPPAAVTLVHAAAQHYSTRDLDSALPSPPTPPTPVPPPAPPRRPRGPRDSEPTLEQQLRAITAGDYITALTGLTPDRAGKINCPFHDDHTPSLQIYQHDWYCFGCHAGGSVIDLAARLWHLTPRGRSYIQLRRRLTDLLLSPTGTRATSTSPSLTPSAPAIRTAPAVPSQQPTTTPTRRPEVSPVAIRRTPTATQPPSPER